MADNDSSNNNKMQDIMNTCDEKQLKMKYK